MSSLELLVGAIGLQKDAPSRYPLWGLTSALAILAAIATASLYSVNDFKQRMEMVAHTHDIQNKTTSAISLAKDAVLGERGFLITSQEQYADIYATAAKAIPQQISTLKAMVTYPDMHRRLAALEALSVEIMAEADMAVAQKKSGKSAEWAMDSSRLKLDQLRELEKKMKQDEALLLTQRQQESEASAGRIFVIVIAGNVIGFALLLTVFVKLRQENAARLHAEEGLRKANEELEARVEQRTVQLFKANQQLGKELAENQRARAEISALNANLERRVVERTAQLAAANQELEAFSYSVSHDLRTPLRSIDGFSQAVLEDCGPQLDEAGKGHLQRVRRATQHMAQLIDDMLALSRVTRSEMNFTTVDLSALAQTLADELQQAQPQRRVEFAIAPGLTAQGDARLLKAALENLLNNAWKFTSRRESAHIEFGAIRHDNEQAYFVRDDGAGFDMAYAGKLFTAFQRLHAMTEFPGTGVGLATVQRIIHRHGGRVWAEGEVGKGATFHFTLP